MTDRRPWNTQVFIPLFRKIRSYWGLWRSLDPKNGQKLLMKWLRCIQVQLDHLNKLGKGRNILELGGTIIWVPKSIRVYGLKRKKISFLKHIRKWEASGKISQNYLMAGININKVELTISWRIIPIQAWGDHSGE